MSCNCSFHDITVQFHLVKIKASVPLKREEICSQIQRNYEGGFSGGGLFLPGESVSWKIEMGVKYLVPRDGDGDGFFPTASPPLPI